MTIVAALVAGLAGALSNGGDLQLTLLPDTLPAASGGRCMDGSMTGYYFRQGATDTFVIFMHGGGGCSTEAKCKTWAKEKGSSNSWQQTSSGDLDSPTNPDCAVNPYFCNATAAIVPYCTGDGHRGNNTVASAATWGWIFDGHASFVAIIEELIRSRGLGNAKRVLLTGASAGGIGVFYNLDWLAARLPGADVKGAPTAGWFVPGALPGDLPDKYPPSDYAHFRAGTHGNPESESSDPGALIELQNWRELLPANCVAAQKPDEWWACGSVHKLYPFLKTPLFAVENLFDTNQIYTTVGMMPHNPSPAEAATAGRYVAMFGEAMRNTTAQVLTPIHAPRVRKRIPDGLFAPACFSHTVYFAEQITPPAGGAGPQSWPVLLGDWFFELNQHQQYHRLVESCPTDMPCNPLDACQYSGGQHPTPAPAPGHPTPAPAPGPGPVPPASPTPAPPPSSCAVQLTKDGCLPGHARDCATCAESHVADLAAAGCTQEVVRQLCKGETKHQ